jgi:pilus assembly protein CpaB
MNRTRLVFIGIIALAFGAFASALVYRTLQQRTGSAETNTQDVVVAVADIPVGTRILDKDVRVVRLAADVIPPGSFHQKNRVVGRGVVLPIAAGEFILPARLAAENGGSGLPSMIPPGMRAVSVRVSDSSSVAGFVLPGTRVDVLMTGNPTGSSEPQTITVLRNVTVLANGQKLDRTLVSGESQNSPVITLAVSPDDAQKLALAASQGHIQLALRNPLDTNQSPVPAVNAHSLYQQGSPVLVAHSKPKPMPVVQKLAPPTDFPVEVIRGNKRDVTKLPEEAEKP